MQENTITEITRRAIIDNLIISQVDWSGRLDEVDFLSRLYDLKAMPSTDHRFSDAADDIWQHRINNWDWDPHWVFGDPRFNLFRCVDEKFLRFLCEMVHPVVRENSDEAATLVMGFNDHLVNDGWEIASRGAISGRIIYAARRLIEGAGYAMRQVQAIRQAIDADYLNQQITRMEAAIQSDPELAIGTAKEFLETLCKTILSEAGATPPTDDLPALIRTALDQITLDTSGAPDPKRAENATRRLLGNLSGLGASVGEVRNALGSGHGKSATAGVADPLYARLVVGSAATMGAFLFEAYLAKSRAHAP